MFKKLVFSSLVILSLFVFSSANAKTLKAEDLGQVSAQKTCMHIGYIGMTICW